MSDITAIGLGLMGSALARAVQQAGHDLTVWNRSAEKMRPLVAGGSTAASDVADAVSASPIILVCVDDYEVTRNLLGAAEVASQLSGRTLIQLSTGTPREARDAENWFQDQGVSYIDGAILALPADIGKADAQILFAGPKNAFKQVEPLLNCLAGDLRYLGENIRAPATLDLAWLCQRFGMIIGAIHGLNLCESEDVDADLYAALFAEGDRVRLLAEAIHAQDFENPSSVTLQVWQKVLQRFQKQAKDAGINNEFPEFGAGLLERAVSSGYAKQDVAALIKVLRS